MYQNKDTIKAVLGESIQVHVLTEAQLKSMADKHTVMIKLSSPYRDKSNNIFWKINDPSFSFKNGMDIAKTNIAIVCKYEELKHDTKLCFVGAFKKKPCDDDMVLLCLIVQTYKKKEVKKMNVQKIFKQCSFIKKPINESADAKHHKSIGKIFGFTFIFLIVLSMLLSSANLVTVHLDYSM